jgi:hypothetical protein
MSVITPFFQEKASKAPAVGQNKEVLNFVNRMAGQTEQRVFLNLKPLPKDLVPECEIPHPFFPKGRPRIDGLWRAGNTIFEFKPNNILAMQKGKAQSQQYAEWMNRLELAMAMGSRPL